MPRDKLSFPYRIVPGEMFMTPIVSAQIIGPTGRSVVEVLVDSGAAFSVFPAAAAEEAGILLANAPEISVIFGGGPVRGWRVRFPLVIGDYRIDSAIMVFVEKLALPYGLLGRNNVFGNFREVAFLQRLKTPHVEFRLDGEK